MAKSKTRTASSAESSPEDILMVGKQRIPAHRITSIHIYELDTLDEFLENAEKEGKEVPQEELEEKILETLQTLRPLYPPALSRKYLTKAFSIRDWRAPEIEDLRAWVEEARLAAKNNPLPVEEFSREEKETLGSYLYLMMTDPRNDYIHAENQMWALWESFWGPNAVCSLSERTVLVGESAAVLYSKVKAMSEGKTPEEMTDLELDAIATQLREEDVLPEAWEKEGLKWKMAYLMGLDPAAMEDLTHRLHALVV